MLNANRLNQTPLSALHAAEAVARHGTLSGAAAELGVTPGAISQRVARCEEALGLTLFERSVHGMAPTDGAGEVLRLLCEGFARLSAAVALTERDGDHRLTVSAAPIFAARWLIFRLADFGMAHPEIKVRIDSDVAMADPNRGDVDLAIRIGRGPYPDLRAERLFAHRFTPVCHADLAQRLQSPRDLARLPIICDTGAMFHWQDWLTPLGIDDLELQPSIEFSDASLCFEAALAGQGVFLSFEILAADALARGQIVAPFPSWGSVGMSYWLIAAQDRAPSLAMRKFQRWLHGELAKAGLETD